MTRAYPSINQERVAKVVAEKLNKRELVEGKNVLAFVGYSEAIQKNPKAVFKSKGFKEALKRLGFSIEAADLTVAKILRVGKEENQLKASDQIYKRLGAYDQLEGSITKVFVIPSELIEKYGIQPSPSPAKNSAER